MKGIKKGIEFTVIGLISGTVLLVFLKLVKIATGSRAYDLLFDVSYIPFLRQLRPVWLIELLFHYLTSISGIVILYYLLSLAGLKTSVMAYVVAIGLASAALFCLTVLSVNTPPLSDIRSWIYWVIGHGLFALAAGILIRSVGAQKNAF